MSDAPFSSLPLTTGDYLTQTRQRTMNNNSVVAWERGARANLPYNDFSGTRSAGANPAGNVTFRVEIDGSLVDSVSVTAGDGAVKLADIDISGFTADALHTLQIKAVASAAGGFTVLGKVLRFVRHKYLDRLSVWSTMDQTISGSGPYTQTIDVKDVTAIIHESVEDW